MKRIAIVENGYVRDSQIFTADPAIIETDLCWENKFSDLKNPCQYIGIFEGVNEEEILSKAALYEGIHPGVISLVDV